MEYNNSIYSSKSSQDTQFSVFDMGSPTIRSSFSSGKLHLDLYELCSRGDKPEYDELDLISECSSPGEYIPGKYLQLCDISSETSKDSSIWPVSLNSTIRTETEQGTINAGQTSHSDEENFSHKQISRRHRQILQNPKYFIPLVVCVIVALFALGGLAAII